MLLQYIYLEDSKIESDIAEDLFKLSHEYLLEKLKNDCEKVLVRNIILDNVINNILLAEKYEVETLRKACLAFAAENLNEVLRTQNYKELDPETLVEIVDFKVLISTQKAKLEVYFPRSK